MIPIRSAVPTRYPALVTWALIAINCAVFLFQLGLGPAELAEFLYRFALIPALYFHPDVVGESYFDPTLYTPFVTMMFLHAGWLHLIFNMWMLGLFGPAVEDRMGHGRYLAFYLGCGIAASLAQMATDPTSTIPSLGASGAIAGVLGCYMRLFPLARVIVLVPILFLPLFFEVYAFVFIGVWFLMQVLQGTVDLLAPSEGGGVAWWAHIGGFLAGVIIGPLLTRTARRYRVYQPDEGELGFDAWGRR
jgi:membrane associated rhomboid family serine protease